jgi:[acyl-carrier-protein] S-malonyltransferase
MTASAVRSSDPSVFVARDPIVFMFPGQSSRDRGAIEKLVGASSRAADRLAEASETLGRDLGHHYRADNPSMFESNRDVQVGVFLANSMYADLLDEQGVRCDLSMGLSLGEYNHVASIGALSWDDTLRLVDARGAAYDRGPAGAMAALAPITNDDIEQLLVRAKEAGFLAISNYNSPSQYVIAGDRAAIDAALAIADDELFVQGTVIEQRIPMHCALFDGVAREFRSRLQAQAWRPTAGPYIANVTADIRTAPPAEWFIESLTRHVCEPVLWRQSIEAVADRWPGAVFIEVGPRSVLFNLLNPRWIDLRKFKTDGEGDVRRLAEQIAADLQELKHA